MSWGAFLGAFLGALPSCLLCLYAGWRMGKRRAAAPVVAHDANEPICGCGHHFSFHAPRRSDGVPGLCYEHGCTCRQYCGPVPLMTMHIPDD